MHLKHHEKQIEDILNYLEELSFHRVEKMKERLVNGKMIIQRDFDELKIELEKVRSQIYRLQKKHIRQKDKIAFARFRISTLKNKPQGYPSLSPVIYRESFRTHFMSSRAAREDHHHQATKLDPYHLQLSRIQPLDVWYK
nr:hypothetical protein [Tanacetum cinerariifolium]